MQCKPADTLPRALSACKSALPAEEDPVWQQVWGGRMRLGTYSNYCGHQNTCWALQAPWNFLCTRTIASLSAPAAYQARRHADTLHCVWRMGAPKPFNSLWLVSPHEWLQMQHTPKLRQWSLHAHLGDIKSPASTVRPASQQWSKILHHHRIKLEGGTSWWEWYLQNLSSSKNLISGFACHTHWQKKGQQY